VKQIRSNWKELKSDGFISDDWRSKRLIDEISKISEEFPIFINFPNHCVLQVDLPASLLTARGKVLLKTSKFQRKWKNSLISIKVRRRRVVEGERIDMNKLEKYSVEKIIFFSRFLSFTGDVAAMYHEHRSGSSSTFAHHGVLRSLLIVFSSLYLIRQVIMNEMRLNQRDFHVGAMI
jgi:hypothetical protein